MPAYPPVRVRGPKSLTRTIPELSTACFEGTMEGGAVVYRKGFQRRGRAPTRARNSACELVARQIEKGREVPQIHRTLPIVFLEACERTSLRRPLLQNRQ